MSILSAAVISAALLGAEPRVGISESPITEVAGRASVEKMIAVSCEHAQPVTCAVSANPWGAGCQTHSRECNGCDNGRNVCKSGRHGWCPWCGDEDDCDDDDDCEPCCWSRHLLNYCVGPGNMYPHYPYPPVYHGYYYFRPYNFEHVFRDSETAPRMGGEPMAPYSVEFLKPYFPPAMIEPIPILPVKEQYPLLEDLLEAK